MMLVSGSTAEELPNWSPWLDICIWRLVVLLLNLRNVASSRADGSIRSAMYDAQLRRLAGGAEIPLKILLQANTGEMWSSFSGLEHELRSSEGCFFGHPNQRKLQ